MIIIFLILTAIFNTSHGASFENAFKIADYMEYVMDKRLEDIYQVKK